MYYRSEATNSSSETPSGTPRSKPPTSHNPSDLPFISANMPMDELIDGFNKMMRNFTYRSTR